MKSAYSQGLTATYCYWGKCWHRNISHDSFMFDPKIGKSAKTWWTALDKISGQPLAFCHFVNLSAKRHCFMGGFRKTPPEPKQASMHLVLFPHRVADASQSRRILEMRKCMKSCNLIDHHVLICTQKTMTSRVSPSTNQQTLRASAHYTILVCPTARWRFFSGWKAAPGQDKGTGTQIMDNAWQHLKRYLPKTLQKRFWWPCYPKIGIH